MLLRGVGFREHFLRSVQAMLQLLAQRWRPPLLQQCSPRSPPSLVCSLLWPFSLSSPSSATSWRVHSPRHFRCLHDRQISHHGCFTKDSQMDTERSTEFVHLNHLTPLSLPAAFFPHSLCFCCALSALSRSPTVFTFRQSHCLKTVRFTFQMLDFHESKSRVHVCAGFQSQRTGDESKKKAM